MRMTLAALVLLAARHPGINPSSCDPLARPGGTLTVHHRMRHERRTWATAVTTFDPTGYPDGLVAGWTLFAGYDLGKSQADVPNRFVVYNGGYINWNTSKSIYQTPTSSRPNHYLKVSLRNFGGDCGVFWNAAADGSSYHSFVQNGSGWSYNYEGGGMSSGTLSGGAAVTTGVAYDLEIDASTAGSPVVKVNGTVVAVGTASTARTGLYVGVYLGASNDAGVIQIEPAGGPAAAPVQQRQRRTYQMGR